MAGSSVEDVYSTLESVYLSELGRMPDESGRETYLPLLLSGEKDGAWLQNVLRQSPEGKAYRVSQRGPLCRATLLVLRLGGLWGAIFVLCWSVGDLVVRLSLRSSFVKACDVFQCFWIGLGSVFGVLFIWSLFAPITSITSLFLGCLATGALVLRFRKGTNGNSVGLRGSAPRWMVFVFLACALLVLAVAASAQREITGYDTFLYHLNAVRWVNSYRAVPGLANLHIRLGTNTAWLLFAAMLNHGPFAGSVAWYMPGFAALTFSMYLVHFLLLRSGTTPRIRFVVGALCLYAISEILSVGPHLYFDAPAQYLLIVAFLEFLCMVEQGKMSRVNFSLVLFLLRVGIPAAASFVVKPIGFPLLLFCGVISLYYLVYHGRRLSRDWRGLLVSVLILACMLLGWGARNVVQTGWLFFPIPVGRFGGDWCVPKDPIAPGYGHLIQSVSGQRLIIQAWGRLPGPGSLDMAGAGFLDWFPAWLAHNCRAAEVRWLFPFGGLGYLLAIVLLRIRGHNRSRELITLFVCTALLLFWLLQAPDLRFGRALFWLWFATGLSFFVSVMVKPVHAAYKLALIVWGIALIFPGAWNVVSKAHWVMGRAPSARMVTKVVNDQVPPLEIYVPVSGDHSGDSPIPSTPYPSPFLQARTAGDMRAGFRVER